MRVSVSEWRLLQELPPEVPSPPLVEQLFGLTLITVLQALLVVAATIIGLRLVRFWLSRALVRGRVDRGTSILLLRLASIGTVTLGAIAVLSIFGVSTAALLAFVGTVSLAFGLAVQDILKNFFSGIYLLLEKPFLVGDLIKIKDQQGTVEHIGVRTTALRTRDNVQVLIPNAVVFAEVVSNHTNQHADPLPPSHMSAPPTLPPSASESGPAPPAV